ncbi:hypothetical protein ACOMHN_058292 [Nucella lapillus]
MARQSKVEKSRIVALAVDDSDHSDFAFNYYYDKIKKDGDKLILIHVAEDPSFLTGAEEKVRQMKVKHTQMSALEKRYTDKLITSRIECAFRVGVGKPGHVIVRLSREENAELLIVGSRGQSKARELIVGSVSKFVICNSHVPVLICKREDDPVGSGSKFDLPVASTQSPPT